MWMQSRICLLRHQIFADAELAHVYRQSVTRLIFCMQRLLPFFERTDGWILRHHNATYVLGEQVSTI